MEGTKFLCESTIFAGENDSLWTLIQNGEWGAVFDGHLVQSLVDQTVESFGREKLIQSVAGMMMAFVQTNFYGPSIADSELTQLAALAPDSRNKLKVDGEELNVNVYSSVLLLGSKLLLDHLIPECSETATADTVTVTDRIWFLRYLVVHQRCLDELSHTLYSKFDANVKELVRLMEDMPVARKIQLMLEITQGYELFKRINKSQHWLSELQKLTGVELAVEGALGVRTKYQQTPLPQLFLEPKGYKALALPSARETHDDFLLPGLLSLNDDVRLNEVSFLVKDETRSNELPALIQNLILTKLVYLHISQPKDNLADEELQPYINTLLCQRCGPWVTRLAALFMNITMEQSHRRTIDRSLRQCDELTKLFQEKPQSMLHRSSLAFSSWLIPRWQVKAKLGDLLVSLNLHQTALDVFLQLQRWEDVIFCYTHIGLRHKAAEVIREQLEKSPSVKLHCMLGDVTDDVECYRQAWTLSGEKSARAQCHWGNYYFVRKDYGQAIEHLKRSVEINCLQESTLLRLGYAALQLEQWEEAAKAYRLYTSLEPDSFEAWNNLATAYIKLGQKVRAHKVLQEALKCNFSNWKVWENFLLISIDTCNYEDALNAYERMVELKEKYFDREVITILVKAITDGVADANGNTCTRLRQKAIKILGHACSKTLDNGYLYELSASLENDDLLRKCQKLQNSYRGYTQTNSQWSKEPASCRQMVTLCCELCENSYKAFIEGKDDLEKVISLRSQLSSARLTGQGCARAASNVSWPDMEELLERLQSIVQEITTELKKAIN